jgi:hypothetical protein
MGGEEDVFPNLFLLSMSLLERCGDTKSVKRNKVTLYHPRGLAQRKNMIRPLTDGFVGGDQNLCKQGWCSLHNSTVGSQRDHEALHHKDGASGMTNFVSGSKKPKVTRSTMK